MVVQLLHKLRVQLFEGVLELLEFRQDKELLVLAAHVVIVGQCIQVVIHSVFIAVTISLIGCSVHNVCIVLVTDLSSLKRVHNSIMDRNLAVL